MPSLGGAPFGRTSRPPEPSVLPLRLVVDADVDNRVATELKARGRDAIALSELELHRLKDEPLLRALGNTVGDPSGWVLVTGDDSMPDDHGDVLRELRVTLATIDPAAARRDPRSSLEERRDPPLGPRDADADVRVIPSVFADSAGGVATSAERQTTVRCPLHSSGGSSRGSRSSSRRSTRSVPRSSGRSAARPPSAARCSSAPAAASSSRRTPPTSPPKPSSPASAQKRIGRASHRREVSIRPGDELASSILRTDAGDDQQRTRRPSR